MAGSDHRTSRKLQLCTACTLHLYIRSCGSGPPDVQEVALWQAAEALQSLMLLIQTLILTPDLEPNPDLTLTLTHRLIGVQEVTPSRASEEPSR